MLEKVGTKARNVVDLDLVFRRHFALWIDRGPQILNHILHQASSHRLSPGHSPLEILRAHHALLGIRKAAVGHQPKYAYTRWGTTRESNDALYRMVHQMNRGLKADPDRFLIPVELVEPMEHAWC